MRGGYEAVADDMVAVKYSQMHSLLEADQTIVIIVGVAVC